MPRSCEAAHEDSKVEAQRGGDSSHSYWSRTHGTRGTTHGTYGRRPWLWMVSWSGFLLQAAPILKRQRRRNREVFAKKGSVLGVSTPRGKYRRRGASRGPTRKPGGLLARPRVGPCQGPSGSPGGGPPCLSWLLRKVLSR